jgi:NAD(P)H-dependent FMN reductase
MKTPIRILGIAGSLRRESYNRAALRAATKLLPEAVATSTLIPGRRWRMLTQEA